MTIDNTWVYLELVDKTIPEAISRIAMKLRIDGGRFVTYVQSLDFDTELVINMSDVYVQSLFETPTEWRLFVTALIKIYPVESATIRFIPINTVYALSLEPH